MSVTDPTGGWTYGYDNNNRLTSADATTQPVPEQPAGGDYGYDWVGNRLNPPADPNKMVYNEADQLTLWPVMYGYTYDRQGNLTEERNPQNTLVSSYTYHPTNLLNQATYSVPGGTRTVTNTWDADSNRVRLTINQDTYSFVYDPTAGIPAVLLEDDGTDEVYYYREPGGALVARLHGDAGQATSWRYYHFDELGSTRLLTDGSGNPTDRYAYDAWGKVISHTGTTEQPYQYVGQLGYYTHYQDPEFKLLQLGVRFYDSETGRFTQIDPAHAGLNHYLGLSANATCHVDPWGLYDFWAPYWNGRGDPVDLNTVGVTDYLRFSGPAQEVQNGVWQRKQTEARVRAMGDCDGKAAGTVVDRWHVTGLKHVNFRPVIFVVGGSHINIAGGCVMKVNCCTHTYELACNITFTIVDSFSDAADLFNTFPGNQEFPGGHPYPMSGWWMQNFYTTGTY